MIVRDHSFLLRVEKGEKLRSWSILLSVELGYGCFKDLKELQFTRDSGLTVTLYPYDRASPKYAGDEEKGLPTC